MADKPVVDVNTDNLADFTKLLYGEADPKTEDVENTPNIADDVDPGANEDADDTADIADEAGEDVPEEDDTDLDGDQGGDPVDANDDNDEEDIFKPKAKPNKKQTAQERINEVIAEKHAERREFEKALAELREEVAQLRAGPKTNDSTAAKARDFPVDADAPDPDAVDAAGNPIYPLGEFDVNYIAEVHRYTARKAAEEVAKEAKKTAEIKAAEAAEAKLFENWQGKLTKAEETFPDLRTSIATLDTEFVDLDPQIGTQLAKTIMEMDYGAEVLYYLANHVDEAKQIVSAGLTGATLALGRLEGKISVALEKKQQKAKPDQAKRQTRAPAPPSTTPRGTGGNGTGRIRPDTDNFQDFKKLFYSED